MQKLHRKESNTYFVPAVPGPSACAHYFVLPGVQRTGRNSTTGGAGFMWALGVSAQAHPVEIISARVAKASFIVPGGIAITM